MLDVNTVTPRKPSCCLVLKTMAKIRQNKKLGFLRNDCAYIGRGRKQKTNEKQGRNVR
jgi:hypothetical protein